MRSIVRGTWETEREIKRFQWEKSRNRKNGRESEREVQREKIGWERKER